MHNEFLNDSYKNPSNDNNKSAVAVDAAASAPLTKHVYLVHFFLRVSPLKSEFLRRWSSLNFPPLRASSSSSVTSGGLQMPSLSDFIRPLLTVWRWESGGEISRI